MRLYLDNKNAKKNKSLLFLSDELRYRDVKPAILAEQPTVVETEKFSSENDDKEMYR